MRVSYKEEIPTIFNILKDPNNVRESSFLLSAESTVGKFYAGYGDEVAQKGREDHSLDGGDRVYGVLCIMGITA